MTVVCPKCGRVGETYNIIEPAYQCRYGSGSNCTFAGFEDDLKEVDRDYEKRKYIGNMGVRK